MTCPQTWLLICDLSTNLDEQLRLAYQRYPLSYDLSASLLDQLRPVHQPGRLYEMFVIVRFPLPQIISCIGPRDEENFLVWYDKVLTAGTKCPCTVAEWLRLRTE